LAHLADVQIRQKDMKGAIVLMAFLAVSCEASGQELDVPTIAFASSAATDWVTTYRNRNYFREGNPVIAWLDHKPVAMIGLGVAIDTAGVYGWQRLTRNHRRLRTIGLYAAAATRFAIAYRNDRMRRVARK
jgi:hypothetical protein